ncbi:MAG: phage/plasmid primase, P4 family [Acidimicrobiales bacterium]
MSAPTVFSMPNMFGTVTLDDRVTEAEQAVAKWRIASDRVMSVVDRDIHAADLSTDEIEAGKAQAIHEEREAREHRNLATASAVTAVELARSAGAATPEEIEDAIQRIALLDRASGNKLTQDPATSAALEVVLASRDHVPPSIDDAHMAEAFAREIRGDFLYVAAQNRWLQWDGRRWATDTTEAIHERCRLWVLELGKSMFELGIDSTKVRKVALYRSRARLDAIVTLARRIDGITARPDDFDADPDVLNVANGTVDLKTGKLWPHNPEDRLTKLAPVDYRPEAQHADIDQLLEVVADDVRDWIIVLLGYAATGHTNEDLVAVLDGGGANGKSTLLEGVAAALGDYAGPAASQLIMRSSRDEHPTIKADLQGRRVVFISETEEGGSLRMEQLKSLTGGDRIKARVMRGDYYDFTPTHTLIVATNHRPFVNATEHAAWRRLRLVPFPFTYKPAHKAEPGDRVQDAHLRQRIVTGRTQREAMLAWIVAGAVSWYRNGMPDCPAIDNATNAWRTSEDVLLRFIGEELTLDPEGEIGGRDLYNAYTDWCRNEGRPAKSNKNFSAEFLAHDSIESAGVTRITRSNVAFYRGVRRTS